MKDVKQLSDYELRVLRHVAGYQVTPPVIQGAALWTCIERLKGAALPKPAHSLVQNVQENLRALTSPFLSRIKASAHLTARELQIADYIKKGKSSKQIGGLMRLSPGTVDFHRNQIRKKLNIRGEKVSLQAYLLNQS